MIESFKIIEQTLGNGPSLEGKLAKLELLDRPFGLKEISDKEKSYRSIKESLEAAPEAELEIYNQANLENNEVNGRECLTRTDIDPEKLDGRGRTNMERMLDGKPPLVDGEPVELHHINQKNDAPLAELKQSEHRSHENSRVLHDQVGESEINRDDFKKERENHWKTRAEMILKSRSGSE